jgi:drug/metabolite transporter (DMT)-like permease
LVPLYFFFSRKRNTLLKENTTSTLKYGMILGFVLFVAANLQQIGMIYTTAAKGGFITSLYVIFVPILGLFAGKKIGLNIWIGAFLAVVGLYLLSMHGQIKLELGDALVLMSALFWALHIFLIERYVQYSNAVLLSIYQFGSTAALSFLVALPMEEVSLHGILDAWIPILYAGLFSVGIAYTLQVFAQKKVQAEIAAIILSFESAFAMLGGWLILNEQHHLKALLGAALMLAGIILSQINFKKNAKTHF